jgi:spore maturation protein CgeB
MKILLVSPFISNPWDQGKYIAKAISELGHHLTFWDSRITVEPPLTNYDLVFVLKGLEVDIDKLRRPRVNWFPDNLAQYKGITEFINKFDYFFTANKEKEGIWLPGALDADIHHPYNAEKTYDVVFVGAAHSLERVKFIKRFMRMFKGRFGLFGNDWLKYGVQAHPLPSFQAFSQIFSTAKIALNIHYDLFGIGTNFKIHEIAGCGSAMLLTDNVDGLGETYPMAPKFNSLEECLELTEYYLNNLRERRKLVKEMQKRAYEKFTYNHQVARILKIVEEKLL